MRRLVEVFLGSHALPGDLLDVLWRETQGYPLFIREVLRGLEEEGTIRLRGAAKRLERPLDLLAIPVRVREAIRLRLEKLPKEERRLVDAAAACGTRFTTALLAKVAGEEESTVLRGLENLVRVHGLLRTTENGFGFDHPVVQEVAYEASPPEVRRAHHLEAAEWLELVGGPVEDVAEHYYRAGEAKAVPKLREAAEGARARYANAEAIRFYNEALSLEADAGKTSEVLEALGSLYKLVGDYAAGLTAYARALNLARTDRERARMAAKMAGIQVRIGEHEKALKNCLEALPLVEGEGVEEEAAVLAQIGMLYFRRGEYDRALEYHRRSLAIQEKIGDPAGLAGSLHTIGFMHHDRGDYDKALEYYGRALAISERIGHLQFLANHLHHIGYVHYSRGDYDKALAYFGRALAIREKIGDPAALAASLHSIGDVHYSRGDYDKALEYLGRAVPISEGIGDLQLLANNLSCIGNVHRDLEDYDKALEHYGRGLAIGEKVGDLVRIAEASTGLAETSIRKGDLLNAERHCERALSVATQVGSKENIGAAKRVRGMLLRWRERWEESAADFEESLWIYTQVGQPFDEGRTHHEFGLMWKDKGDRERAREHLSQAVRLFERIGAKIELERAREALRELP